jgi:hypothetical protein
MYEVFYGTKNKIIQLVALQQLHLTMAKKMCRAFASRFYIVLTSSQLSSGQTKKIEKFNITVKRSICNSKIIKVM